ncbi:phage tail terminator-like protein [Jiella avicenniae]|uniref:DUF4128 domain-containing protein n=1 Tax=Jiella avicenniae TaxID=2907202 RepID=A0A9X1P176_9HYPH|nr:phage tail terminator-like protein [Jiella avicenniae]MCE7028475.1 DUF4128 domain-containing protein [Jiella avicenniae]
MPASGINGKIGDALEGHLVAFVTDRALPVYWLNKTGPSPTPPTYLETSLTRNNTRPTAFRTDTLKGLFQISVRSPLGVGNNPADEIADALVTLYARGTWITRDGITVRVANSWAAGPFKDDTRWHVPVIVDWFVQNNL